MRSRDWERRAITVFMMMFVAFVAFVALRPAAPAQIALPLAVAAGLLGRVVAFYFPLPARRSASKRKRRFPPAFTQFSRPRSRRSSAPDGAQ